jgi:MATE family multidrug resistance protein
LSELRPLLRLAGPVILAEIGWMSMGLVDTAMVGPLGPAAIAATGMGNGVFTAIMIFGAGLMLGVDALVSRAMGAGRLDDGVRWLHQAVILALIVAPIIMTVTWIAFLTIGAWGLNPQIAVLAKPYLAVIALGAPPLMLYSAFRRYLQGIAGVAPRIRTCRLRSTLTACGTFLRSARQRQARLRWRSASSYWRPHSRRGWTRCPLLLTRSL